MRLLHNLKTKTIILALIVLSGISTPFAHDRHDHSMFYESTGIVIHDPWIRSASPNAPALGVFMQINNNSNQDVKLVSAHADGYEDIQLHRTIDNHGIMNMVEQKFMPILANGKLHLKPGSWHIMLINPTKVPSEGEVVMIKLQFDNGSSQMINFKVRKGKMMINHRMH